MSNEETTGTNQSTAQKHGELHRRTPRGKGKNETKTAAEAPPEAAPTTPCDSEEQIATPDALEQPPIRPVGVLDISRAAALKEQLLKALASGSGISFSLEEVTELDITALQLLWAAQRAAEGRLRVLGELPAEVVRALAETGVESVLAAIQKSEPGGVTQ
jgi:anti-anti-sigma regulatory factor